MSDQACGATSTPDEGGPVRRCQLSAGHDAHRAGGYAWTFLYACPTPCDDDCEEPCHEVHELHARRDHRPEDCPGPGVWRHRAEQAEAERDQLAAASNRMLDLIDSYPPGSSFARSGAQALFHDALLDQSAKEGGDHHG